MGLLIASVAISCILFILAEFGGTSFRWNVSAVTDLYVTASMELLTLCVIPIALRMFKLSKIKKRLYEGKEKELRLWGSLRMMMLCIPMIFNSFFYLVLYKASFAYLAIILFICLFFIYPSLARCQAEVTPPEN